LRKLIRHTGHHARSIVKSFFASNLRCLVSFFVSDAHVDRFYETLEATSSGIAGSVVTSILTAPYRHAWAPSNLNIFIPIGFLKEWVSVLSYIGLKQTKEQAGVSRQYRHTAGAHVVFESVIEVSFICGSTA
jgi:hypothetical protein